MGLLDGILENVVGPMKELSDSSQKRTESNDTPISRGCVN